MVIADITMSPLNMFMKMMLGFPGPSSSNFKVGLIKIQYSFLLVYIAFLAEINKLNMGVSQGIRTNLIGFVYFVFLELVGHSYSLVSGTHPCISGMALQQ
jgi:hypothetical protein